MTSPLYPPLSHPLMNWSINGRGNRNLNWRQCFPCRNISNILHPFYRDFNATFRKVFYYLWAVAGSSFLLKVRKWSCDLPFKMLSSKFSRVFDLITLLIEKGLKFLKISIFKRFSDLTNICLNWYQKTNIITLFMRCFPSKCLASTILLPLFL